jgi:hypothetical protein
MFSKTLSSAALVLLAASAVAGPAEPTVAQPTNGNAFPGAKDNFDPVYNVCRGTDPRCYNPWVETRQNKVLLFTRTAGPRHANLGPSLTAGLNPPLLASHVVQNAIIAWMLEQGVTVDWTEDVTRLSNLNQYKAVIFASTSRDVLWKHGTAVDPAAAVNTRTSAYLDAGKVSLRQYIRAGGGFVGIHNAFGTEYNWPWYEGLLAADSSTAGVGSFGFRDEWYNLVPYPTRVKFLATVDENSLATKRTTHPGHGDFHPVAWCQYYDGGRAWLTTMGHDGQAFTDGSGFPGQVEFKKLIVGGILSAMGNTPFCQ